MATWAQYHSLRTPVPVEDRKGPERYRLQAPSDGFMQLHNSIVSVAAKTSGCQWPAWAMEAEHWEAGLTACDGQTLSLKMST